MQEKMNYMFQAGFLGTRAPFFMDFVTVIVAILPFIVYGSIIFAKQKNYKMHILSQNIIFVTAVIVLGYFEYGVRVGGGFDAFIEASNISHLYAGVVLVVHIIISIVMLFYWIRTVVNANINRSKGFLPGTHSKPHKLLAMKTFIGIMLSSFTGVWVYTLLFMS